MIIHNFKILCIMAINYSLVKLASKFGDKAGVPKFYARAQMNESISLKKFAKLIAMQTTVSYADVTAVLISLQENMVIELQRGNQIDFGELGKFRLQLTSEGAATAAEFKSDINIKGVNIQFIPGSDLANIFVGMEFEHDLGSLAASAWISPGITHVLRPLPAGYTCIPSVTVSG